MLPTVMLLRLTLSLARSSYFSRSRILTTITTRASTHGTPMMKRKAAESIDLPASKRQKEPEPDYCDVAPQTDDDGTVVWPAAAQSIEDARNFIRRWFGRNSASNTGLQLILIVKCHLFGQDAHCAG